jgi:CheY-like chemotaxis protein
MMSTATSTVEILLVEDNPSDVFLTRRVIKDCRMPNRLSVARDGVEALLFLNREEPFRDAPLPDLILLDLNLPRKNGRELLLEIKNDDRFKHIPVVVLTTSNTDADIMRAYQSHANCYIVKPVDMNQFVEVIRGIEAFWFMLSKLPAPGARE